MSYGICSALEPTGATRSSSRTGWQGRRRLVENYIRANGHICYGLDGLSPHPAEQLEVDHLVPLALGGTDRDGLRILCSKCNRSRGGKLGNALREKGRLHSRQW